jgi:hypothetical protein
VGIRVFNLIFLILKNLVIFSPKISKISWIHTKKYKNPNTFQFCFGRDCYHMRMGISG